MIQQFVGSVVGGPVVGGRLTSRSVACGFNKIQKKKKHVWGNDFAFDQGLFCYSNSNFFYVGDKYETFLIARSGHLNL